MQHKYMALSYRESLACAEAYRDGLFDGISLAIGVLCGIGLFAGFVWFIY